jgi:hypothetical protein
MGLGFVAERARFSVIRELLIDTCAYCPDSANLGSGDLRAAVLLSLSKNAKLFQFMKFKFLVLSCSIILLVNSSLTKKLLEGNC